MRWWTYTESACDAILEGRKIPISSKQRLCLPFPLSFLKKPKIIKWNYFVWFGNSWCRLTYLVHWCHKIKSFARDLNGCCMTENSGAILETYIHFQILFFWLRRKDYVFSQPVFVFNFHGLVCKLIKVYLMILF